MAKKKQIPIPTARQLPSGNWFVQLRIDGQSISITKPTEREAIAEAMAIKEGIIKARKTPRSSLTLYAAIDDYITQRQNVLSPATVAGYRVIQRDRFKQLHKTRVCDIDSARWQRAVNAEAKILTDRKDENGNYKPLSAKTLKNSAMFIQTVIAEYAGDRQTARLPQVIPNDLPWLTPEQIPLFLHAIKGNKYEIPALLALSSLRQSEIVAMQWKDIDLTSGTLTVHGSAVLDDKGESIQKQSNKNLSSRRTVPFLIPQLREAVTAHPRDPDGYVYPHYSNVLRLNINKLCSNTGLPPVGIHGLRRSFASLCYHLGISEAVTMISGGWSDFRTMRKIYTKISETDIQTQAEKFNNFFKIANETANAP
ncbi:MAG: site-specific integrase [Clostridia bacterium]|nr:site-specific integrase [Clostridia bacterium]